jgi:hypothetical protein
MKINLAKSELVPVGNVDHVDWLVSILGCGLWGFLYAFKVFWSIIGGLL